jgi:hypothetical protein
MEERPQLVPEQARFLRQFHRPSETAQDHILVTHLQLKRAPQTPQMLHTMVNTSDAAMRTRSRRSLRRGRSNGQESSSSDVDARQRENVFEKCPVGVWISAVDDRMCASQHHEPL